MTEQRQFIKGQIVSFEDEGETRTGFVVAWYRDLFTGAEMVGIDPTFVDISVPESSFEGYDDDRIDLLASDVTLV